MALKTATKAATSHPHANTSSPWRTMPQFTRVLPTVTWKQAAALDADWHRPGGALQSFHTHFWPRGYCQMLQCRRLGRLPWVWRRRGKKMRHTSYLWFLEADLTWWLDTRSHFSLRARSNPFLLSLSPLETFRSLWENASNGPNKHLWVHVFKLSEAINWKNVTLLMFASFSVTPTPHPQIRPQRTTV